MRQVPVRLIPAGHLGGVHVPLGVALVDQADIVASGVSREQVLHAIARSVEGPVGINVIDLNAITTTSDGVLVEGAIVKMAAADHGRIHPEFGMLAMAHLPITPELLHEEPHLAQIEQLFPGRPLYRGPDPSTKHVPVHNAVITGRAVNNNSATEMMNVVTMHEILLPILGQLQLMRDGDVLVGQAGEHISVGIGMTVAERFGRVFPFRQFKAGDTAHHSGAHAKTLKRHIPALVAPKGVLAQAIARALRCGMVPGRHLGCSPAVLACARHLGSPIAWEAITPRALVELASVGIDDSWRRPPDRVLSDSELIDAADAIIPGIPNAQRLPAAAVITRLSVAV
jgi:hypothetical protein